MRQRGFSLLEILVAFSILALSLGILMQVFSGATSNADLARDQIQATELARSLLVNAAAEPALVAGVSRGTTSDTFHWQVEVSPHQDDGADSPSVVTPPSLTDLWRIGARVAWGGTGGRPERSVSIATLRVRPRAMK